MLVLQAGFDEGRLILWGETSPEFRRAPLRERKGVSGPKPSPFAADGEMLVDAASRFASEGAHLSYASRYLFLPTIQGKPLPSTTLVDDAPPPDGPAELVAWRTAAVPLDAAAAVALLAACLDRSLLEPGAAVGKTLAFWAAAARFAGALVAREQFVPDLERLPQGSRAVWTPLVVGADAQRSAQLAEGMPPACRALSRTADAPPQRPAEELVSQFVRMVVDERVRSKLSLQEGSARRAKKGEPAEHASVHDAWLAALRSRDGRLEITAGEIQTLSREVSAWRKPLEAAAAAPVRLCFRLEAPEEAPPASPEAGPLPRSAPFAPNSAAWRVRYLLQAHHDPSLLVPAAEAWGRAGDVLGKLLHRPGFRPAEYLLSALGQAAALCPPIAGSLREAAPEEFAVDAAGAFEFLNHGAFSLEQAGFGVLLPAWWTGKGTKQRLTATARTKPVSVAAGGGLTLSDVIRFDWEMALGGEKLSLSELRQLARLKAPLVQIRGQWVQVSLEEIKAAVAFLEKRPGGTATVRELVAMSLGTAPPPAGLPSVAVAAEGPLEELLGKLSGRREFAELPPPAGFHGTLRPYQQRGYSWLAFLRHWGLGACLADDMGLGKTIQTLALVQSVWKPPALAEAVSPAVEAAAAASPVEPRQPEPPTVKPLFRRRGAAPMPASSVARSLPSAARPAAAKEEGPRPTLLVCPTSVVGNWQKEAAKFTPELPVMVHHGLKRRRGEPFLVDVRKSGLVLTSYALLHRDLDLFQQASWGAVVLDEAQNIKNPDTKQAQAARALKCEHRVALTGTPVENHVGDLWSIMEFLNPGMLGGQADFRRRFVAPIQFEGDREAAEQLKRRTGPFILRRLKTDKTIIADLPEKQEMKVYCTLTKEQASLYQAVVEEAEASIATSEGISRKGQILAMLTRLKQVCNHPAHFLGDGSPLANRSGKLARLVEMLTEVLESGEKALIFSQFTEMGGMLRKFLQEAFGREALFIHGGVDRKERDRLVERFQTETGPDAPRLFLLSLKAGGTGLNLTAANHVFHFDRWWNPAVENQATDRAFRIGQNRAVQVHKFVCLGTIEERIDDMIERKSDVAGRTVGAGESWLTELSNEQLRDLLALRPEALAD